MTEPVALEPVEDVPCPECGGLDTDTPIDNEADNECKNDLCGYRWDNPRDLKTLLMEAVHALRVSEAAAQANLAYASRKDERKLAAAVEAVQRVLRHVKASPGAVEEAVLTRSVAPHLP